jgi:predicted ester cyclase
MSTPRETMERTFAVIDGQRWDEFEAVISPDVTMRNPDATLNGAAEWVAFSKGFVTGFPDGRHTVQTVVAEGDRIALTGDWNGAHTGAMATLASDVPPAGVRATLHFCAIGRQRDGLVTEVDVVYDRLALLGQLGLLPEPASA